jgi:transcriptional regulator with XRE-family HTH domain
MELKKIEITKEMLGEKIREARENYSKKIGLKFTQSNLAKKINLTRGYICDLETGKAYPSFQTLLDIANACEVPLSWFTGECIPVPDELKSLGIDYINAALELKHKGLSPEDIRKLSKIADLFRDK